MGDTQRCAASFGRIRDVPSILVTGVSTGLGRSLALRAHAAGWRVSGTIRDNTTAEENGLPSDMAVYRLEPRFPHAVRAFAERFLADQGAPDVLVNNTGTVVYAPLEELTGESLRDLFQVNTLSAVELTTALLPAMRDRGSGTIVNISSVGGRFVLPFFTASNATRHALEAFSEGLWHELKPFGIRVKIIEPGHIEAFTDDANAVRAEPMGPYAQYLTAMNAFMDGIRKHTSAEDAADEVWRAIMDPSSRLRYPVAAYARRMLRARAFFGMAFIRFMHGRWMRSSE